MVRATADHCQGWETERVRGRRVSVLMCEAAEGAGSGPEPEPAEVVGEDVGQSVHAASAPAARCAGNEGQSAVRIRPNAFT